MNINSNYASIYGFYNNLFQNAMSLYNNKLSKMFGAVNNVRTGSALSSSSVRYANSIKSASSELESILDELTGGGAWNKKSMVSSDEDVMTVEYTGMRTSGLKPISVKIDKIAAGQTNDGTVLDSDEKFGTNGVNKFAIESGGEKTEFSINISAADSNLDVQKKMADAVNKAGIGLKASVVSDSSTNTSSLKIESIGIGDDENNTFTISDVSGNAVAKTGAANVTQDAQDAAYSIDGGSLMTSKTNRVDLGNGITAVFIKASDNAITVESGIDKGYSRDLVKDLVSSYNDLYSAAANNASGDAKASKLLGKLVSTARVYSGILSSVGIDIHVDGSLSIDSKKLDEASKDGRLENFFTENSGRSFGFANQLGKLAGDVGKNLSNYVSKSVLGDELTMNFGYSMTGSLIQYNYLGAGSILDYTF